MHMRLAQWIERWTPTQRSQVQVLSDCTVGEWGIAFVYLSKYWVRMDIKGTNMGRAVVLCLIKIIILALTMRYWFIGLIIFVIIRIVLETMGARKGKTIG